MRRFKVPALILGVAVTMGLLAPVLAQAETSPLLSDAIARAAADGKPVLVDFYTDW
jgi:hypothetical protein